MAYRTYCVIKCEIDLTIVYSGAYSGAYCDQKVWKSVEKCDKVWPNRGFKVAERLTQTVIRVDNFEL